MPAATDQSVTTDEDTPKIITLAATDADGDTLTFSIATDPTLGTLGAISPPSCVAGGCTADVTYTPNANDTGPDSFTFTANDGQADSAPATVSITVTPVNDAPSATAQAESTNEDTAVQITLAGTDVDGDALLFSVATGPTNGALGAIDPPSCVAGSCTATVTYTPAANFNGHDSFTFTVNDGTVDSAPATVDITVDSVNDAPSFTKGIDQTVNEDAGLQTITDWATNRLAGPPDESGQKLDFIVTTNNDPLFFVPPAISADGTLTYQPAANANGTATVTVALHDDGGTANGGVDTPPTQTFTITVNAVNDAPVLATIEATSLPYTEGDPATAITATLTVTDIDSATLSGATIQITAGYINGQDVLAFANTATITGSFNATTGTLTLSGTDTLANYQTALRAVTYNNVSQNPSIATRTISFQVIDGAAANNLSSVVTRTVTVTAVNDAPVNTVPGTQTTTEDTARLFNVANTNVMSAADVDAGASSVQVTLTAANGTVTLSGIGGLAFTAGDGTADATMTFTGTIANINTALLGMSFTPAVNFNDSRGSASLTILTNDQGNTGVDPGLTDGPTAEQDSDTVAISVTAVNDAPTATAKTLTAQTNMPITYSRADQWGHRS